MEKNDEKKGGTALRIDFHSHILPAADHGSDGITTTLAQLRMMHEAGTDAVVATPHFYPDSDNAEEYAETTQKAYIELTEEIKHRDLPKIFLIAFLHNYWIE